MNILFWNTYGNSNKSNINDSLFELISENKCDLIVLAEYNHDIKKLCHSLNIQTTKEYHPIPSNGGCERIIGLINKKYRISILNEQTRYQIIKIETSYYQLLIAMIHNTSKFQLSDDAQRENLRIFHQDIIEQEEKHTTRNTLVIGDFNANPFESSCVAANSLHAIPYINEVKNPTRIVQEKKYQKFYNPTWKFFSKREIPYTTYYCNKSDLYSIYWNIFDQVVIRPELIDAFVDESLCIISETRNHKLLERNKPNKVNYSDHLPLFLKLEEGKIK